MRKRKLRRRIEPRPVDSLRPHPAQDAVFGDLPDAELQLLADDMQANGQANPIEILADGTIICGHQRVRAAKLLSWTRIECWVRDDLEAEGEAAVMDRLIADNLHRRQLSHLAIARCYAERKKLGRNNLSGDADGDLRDLLAKQFDLGGRQLDRYARMLDAPIEVQLAYERGELTQRQVLSVVGLDADDQQEIADQITGAAKAADVVERYIRRSSAGLPSVETIVHRLVRAVKSAERDLSGRCDEVEARRLSQQLEALDRGCEFLGQLHQDLTRMITEEEEDDDDFAWLGEA